MTIAEQVMDEFKREMEQGANQTFLAKKHGIPRCGMRRLLVGQTKIEDISIGRLQAMFPNATIDLGNKKKPIELNIMNSGNTTARATNGNATVRVVGGGGDDYRFRAVVALAKSGLKGEQLDTAIRAIEKL